MNHAFAIQHCRIVAPEKLPDRFLASGLLSQPAEGTAARVSVAYILEVTKPWFPSSQVLPTLISILSEQLPALSASPKLEAQFEGLLRQLNDSLNALSEQGETDWIGNLNGLIVAVAGSQLHFSQTGRCPAYLLQNNRIRQITDDLSADHDPHPLKTFSNLASGVLQENDQILIANQELYNEISLDALRRVMNSHTPAQASLSIAKELVKEKNQTACSLIIRVISPGSAQNQKAEEPTEIFLEEEMQSRFKKLQKKLTPALVAVKKGSGFAAAASLMIAKKTGTSIQKNVVPAALSALKKGTEQAQKLRSRRGEPTVDTSQEDDQPAVELILPTAERERQNMQKLARQAEEKAETTYTPAGELPEESEEAEATPARAAAPKPTSAKAKLAAWFSNPFRSKLTILAAAAILLSFSIWSALSRHTPSIPAAATAQNVQLLDDAQAMAKKAATAVSLKQDVEASREIQQGTHDLDMLAGLSDDQKKQAEAAWDALTAQSDTLTSTTRLAAPTATYSFPSASRTVLAGLPYFYGFNSSGSALLRSGRGDPGQTQSSVALPDTDDSIISLAPSNENDSSAFILTHRTKVYRVIQTGTTTTLQAVQPSEGAFATGDAVMGYNGNIYILDGKTGLLWKYVNSGSAYAKGVSIIDSTKHDLKQSLSFAIDGSIYLLKQDGSVLQFTSGQQQSFALKNQPYLAKSFVQPLQIITNENMSSIYIADAGLTSGLHSTAKIYEFSKEGDFIRSYGLPKEYTAVTGFDIDPKAKKLWVVNSGQISEFDI